MFLPHIIPTKHAEQDEIDVKYILSLTRSVMLDF